jgi:hypothetical protein
VTSDASGRNVEALVTALASKDAVERRKAREALAAAGTAAVPALLATLDSSDQHLRWEAAKTLTAIADPAAAERLVAALADKHIDVRWVVGEALIALRGHGVQPLLRVLTQPASELPDGLLQGAHHVLHDLAKHEELAETLAPILKAFDEPEPGVAIPPAAKQALQNESGKGASGT